jgi:hypothetical protein
MMGDDVESAELLIETSNVNKLARIYMIGDMAANMGKKVSITGKLVSVKETEEIRANDRVYTKRKCVFSDSSTAIRLVFWENQVNSAEEGKCLASVI